jgi:hypothetical protein
MGVTITCNGRYSDGTGTSLNDPAKVAKDGYEALMATRM